MKIRVASDLHYEHTYNAQRKTRHAGDPYPEFWVPPEMPDDKDTVLILAGDLYNGLKSIPIIQQYHHRFKGVVVVLGNHDYYDKNIHTLADEYKDELIFQEMDNVYLLDRDTIRINDVLFVGATLWTDMNNWHPLSMMYAPSYMVPDFLYINEGSGYDENYIYRKSPLTVDTWLSKNREHYQYIKTIIDGNPNDKICVVTHHGCTFEAVGTKFKNDKIGNGYFFSEYSDYIADKDNIVAWIHGHTHTPVDLMIGETKVVSNPFGYQNEHNRFDEYLTIEI